MSRLSDFICSQPSQLNGFNATKAIKPMANVRMNYLFLLLYLQPSSLSTPSKQNAFNKLKDSALCSLYITCADTAFYPRFYPKFGHYLYLKHRQSPGFTICSSQKRARINASVKPSETWPNCFTQLFSPSLKWHSKKG